MKTGFGSLRSIFACSVTALCLAPMASPAFAQSYGGFGDQSFVSDPNFWLAANELDLSAPQEGQAARKLLSDLNAATSLPPIRRPDAATAPSVRPVTPFSASEMIAVTSVDDLPDMPDIHLPARELRPITQTPLNREIPSAPQEIVDLNLPRATDIEPLPTDIVPTQQRSIPTNEVVAPVAPAEPAQNRIQRFNPSPSFSDAVPPRRDNGPVVTDFSFVLGAGFAIRPDYLGSDENEFAPNLLFDLNYQDRVFLSSKNGLGFVPYKTANIYTDVHAKYWAGRQDEGDLEGLDQISSSVAVGATLGFRSPVIDVDVTGDWGVVGDNSGLLGTVSASRWIDLNDSFSFRPRGYIQMGDGNWNDLMFGVSDQEVANFNSVTTTGETIQAFQASRGINQLGLSLDLEYSFTPTFSVLGSGEISALVGDAADSPIVDDLGSPTQWNIGLMGVYRF